MMRNLITLAVLALSILLVSDVIQLTPIAAANNERGRKLYFQYCASCHGADGRGQGPVAASLAKPLPDLTRIEKKNGKFPGIRVRLVIEGEVVERELTAHGTKTMPVWGRVFDATKRDKGLVMLDLSALTRYIESIQQK